MQIEMNLLLIAISCVALAIGASWLVDSAARIAKKLGISELVIGLTVVAFGTSAPEFAVTISGALAGNPDISVGNVVGSNIFNIGFILGLCILVRNIKTRPALVWRDTLLLLIITIALVVMSYNNLLSRFEGGAMFLLLIGYIFYLYRHKEPVIEAAPTKPASWIDVPMLIAGLVLIIGGGHYLVKGAVVLAEIIGLSKWVIGITVVAAGTSVPELVISVVALLKKHDGISAGNLIGSNIFNTLGVLGLAALLHPLAIEPSAMFSLVALVVLTLLVLIFMRTGWQLARWEGLAIILLSLAIWVYNFMLVKPPAG